MTRLLPPYARTVLAASIALAVAGCGGSDEEGSTPPAAAAGGAATVSVEEVDGAGEVLVDASGAALYIAEQEADGRIRCTGGCLSFWEPLTLRSGTDAPTGSSGISEALDLVRRPDGARQVTYGGAPLYRFVEDSPGEVGGDGLSDSFDGRRFTWHVAAAEGEEPAEEDGGYSY